MHQGKKKEMLKIVIVIDRNTNNTKRIKLEMYEKCGVHVSTYNIQINSCIV